MTNDDKWAIWLVQKDLIQERINGLTAVISSYQTPPQFFFELLAVEQRVMDRCLGWIAYHKKLSEHGQGDDP